MKSFLIRTLFVTSFLALSAPAVRAQFPGDMFFSDPSVTIVAGETGDLEVVAFSGSDAFGAAHFDLVYDPAELEIVTSAAGDSGELGAVATRDSAGMISVVAMNNGSATQPIGTVSLRNLTVRPLLPAGSNITVQIVAHSALKQNNGSFGSVQGFSATITVVNPPTAGPGDSADLPPLLAAGDWEQQQALSMRRPGHRVLLYRSYWAGRVLRVMKYFVQTYDPNAPSD